MITDCINIFEVGITDDRVSWNESQWDDYYNAVGEQILEEEELLYRDYLIMEAEYWIDIHKEGLI